MPSETCMHITLDKRTRLIAFWVIFAVLVFARMWDIGIIPSGLNQDEAMAGYNTYTLIHHGRDSFGYPFPMYLTAWGSGMNALESYLAIPFVAVFGLHIWTLRLVPLLVSLLTLVVIYRIIREFMKNDLFALFALFFTGVMPWHIMLSRWALESNMAPAFLVFGLYFFLKGINNEKFFLLSSLFYGLSLYTYATLWIVLPFILLAELIYLIVKRLIHFNPYTILSFVLLLLLALPAFLFLLVNNDVIDEIKTPFLSIPKLLYYRSGEISFSKIGENLQNLWNILWYQTDGLPWNSTEAYGIIYRFSLPFAGFGLLAIVIPPLHRLRGRIHHWIATSEWPAKPEPEPDAPPVSLGFFTIINILAGITIGALVNVNINRVNLLFIPLILITAYGLYYLFTHWKWTTKWMLLVPTVCYLACFVQFEAYYFSSYADETSWCFNRGLSDVIHFMKDNLSDVSKVYITPDANYAQVLFYDQTDLNTWLDTVRYTNYPDPFLDVDSFDYYQFDIDFDRPADGSSVYIVNSYEDTSVLTNSMANHGYTFFRSYEYTIYYPSGKSKSTVQTVYPDP